MPEGRRGEESWRSGGGRGLVWGLDQTLAALTPAPGEAFGSAVAISGDRVLVAGPYNKNLLRPGTVYAFTRRDGWWTVEQVLQAPAPVDGDGFGVAIQLTGDSALVGSCGDGLYELPTPTQPGRVYEYRLVDSAWSLATTLEPAPAVTASDRYGCAIARDGDVAAIGAPRDNSVANAAGAAYVFARAGESWSFVQQLTASDAQAGDEFGASLALRGGTLLVGAVGEGDPYAGAAYAYRWELGAFGGEQKLVAADGGGDDRFGMAVALEGDTAAVGARFHTDPSYGDEGYRTGAVFVYRRSEGVWSFERKLLPCAECQQISFGTSVTMQADTLMVGATDIRFAETPGRLHVYLASGSDWVLDRTIVSPSLPTGAAFGHRVALDQDQGIVGAPLSLGQGSLVAAGAAVVLTRSRYATGDGCTTADDCDSGYCVDGVCCDDACGEGLASSCFACSVARGAEVDGTCGPATEGTACDDGTFCTADDRCAAGLCVGGPSPCPGPNDNDDCAESCDELTRSCTAYDGDFASCLEGACVDGSCLKDDGGACRYGVECASNFCVDGLCCAVASCAPYRCQQGGGCATRCQSTGECASGYQCASTGECLPLDAIAQGRACACRVGSGRRDRDTRSAVGTALIGLWCAIRRRRWRRSTPSSCGARWCTDKPDVRPRGTPSHTSTVAALLLAASLAGCGPERSTDEAGQGEAATGRASEPLIWAERQKLEPEEGLQWELGGISVAMQDDLVAMGAPGSPYFEFPGRVHLFTPSASGEWREQQTLMRSDAYVRDYFGASLALDGDQLLVGSAWDDSFVFPGEPGGDVHLFTRDDSGFVEQQPLEADGVTDADDFGMAVAIFGDAAAVGAPRSDYVTGDGTLHQAGCVHLFDRVAGVFEHGQTLHASDATEQALFGFPLALDGEWLIVGARDTAVEGLSEAGAAYLFRRTPDGWVEEVRLVAPDPAAGDSFGYAVAVRGARAAVGAPLHDEGAHDAGAVYWFEHETSGWALREELLPLEPEAGDMFGAALAFSADSTTLGVGAPMAGALVEQFIPSPGKAYVFHDAGSGLVEAARLQSTEQEPDGEPAAVQLGMSLAVGAAGILAGAPGAPASDESSAGTRPGAAYLFALARANGEACTTAHECASGFCVDEICCDSGCGTDEPMGCRVCRAAEGAVADGVCTALDDGTLCDDGAFCNGEDRCRSGECTDHGGYPCLGRHDGDEDCSESCSELARACTAPDDDNVACADGRCRQGICARNPGASCESAIECRYGNCVDAVCCLVADCGPYRCGAQGACLQSCGSANDCASGYRCASTGQCLADAPPEVSGACACRIARSGAPSKPHGRLGLVGALPILFGLRLRRWAGPGWLGARRRR